MGSQEDGWRVETIQGSLVCLEQQVTTRGTQNLKSTGGEQAQIGYRGLKSTGKPSVIFVLNKENDLTVYRCC